MSKAKLIPVLVALLAVQLLLAGILNWSGSADGGDASRGPLLAAVDMARIDAVRIEGGDSLLELKKVDQQWRLPALDFAADSIKLQELLDKLGGLEKGWPVATTGGAAKRFKVADSSFERKISLMQDDQTQAVLYVGTSPNYRYVHARVDGEDEIYSVEFSAFDAATEQDDWIDKDVLKQPLADIQSVSWNGMHFTRLEDGSWQLAGLGDAEQGKQSDIQALLTKLAAIRIESVLGKENKPEYGLAKPEHTLTFTLVNGQQVHYALAKAKDQSHFVVKSSALDAYVQVPAYVINPILDSGRETLVAAKSEQPADATAATAGS